MIRKIGYSFLVLSGVLGVAWGVIVSSSFWGGSLVRIESSSMVPKLPLHSIVHLAKVSATSLKSGNIIAFSPPAPYPHETVVHAIAAMKAGAKTLKVSTEGVAVGHRDPWTLNIPTHAIVWRAIGVITPLEQHLLIYGLVAVIAFIWLGVRFLQAPQARVVGV